MRDENNRFDIAVRDERGLLIYDREHVRSFFTKKEKAERELEDFKERFG